eukprot:CAMPEP_0181327324 /NCGR_PEP_ID=MMETSP1101-20121128/22036_1 /TAXON_ID=46948 /ORGANISM="Rhodomonas abbreviata, Strain Caron Lab Isolate" /LENGTH=356 /DNA_ID=CAMNT_0023435967 /DNA_START=151 /DNA_END=1221 /DNA_ORIENTATION=-
MAQSNESLPRKEFNFRQLSTVAASDLTFRLCTYNVLVQDFVCAERYPTVKDTALVFNAERRRKMLVQDVQQANADIFCFEEIWAALYADIEKALGDDYSGQIVCRQDQPVLHNAMFFRKSKFTLENNYVLNLNRELSSMDDFPKELEEFKTKQLNTLCNHFSIMQGEKKLHLIVLMAHFHHRPDHDLVKYAEMSCLLNDLRRVTDKAEESSEDVFVVVAGDFNAQPLNQVYSLAMGEKPTMEALEQESMVTPEWLEQRKGWFPLYEKIYANTTPSFFGKLGSVYSVYTPEFERGHPKYTNLTDGFYNNIDYIFHGLRLQPTKLLELDHATYEKEEFLPSSLHASDHVMLMAELKFV